MKNPSRWFLPSALAIMRGHLPSAMAFTAFPRELRYSTTVAALFPLRFISLGAGRQKK